MPHIIVENLCKSYQSRNKKAEPHEVLKDFSLAINRGEFVTFFGPNACGKSTLLYILAGLISYDSGNVKIDGKDPSEAKIGYIFQNAQASLFPWKNSLGNVAFSLELQGVPKIKRASYARQFLKELNFAIPEAMYPYQLSGGQQQLVAIARALINQPDMLLMDEPFNDLDYQTRLSMHIKLLEIWQKTKITILFVSHDIEEAVFLADRIVLLSKRPAMIVKILENKLNRPRNHEMLRTQEFFNLKSEALKVFEKILRE